MTTTDVSVVIPVRNGAGTLSQQLDALTVQRTDRSWEIVLADNGSSDGTLEVARRHTGIAGRLRIVDASERTGINFARNRGAAGSSGRYILFCDSDDVVCPTWVEALSRALDDSDLATGPLEYERLNSDRTHRPPPCWDAPMLGLGWKPFAYGANLGVRKQALNELRGFDESFLLGGDDVDLSWRAMVAGYSLGFAEDAVVHYRLRERFRDVVRQSRRYAAGDALLYRKFHRHGLGRRSTRQAARQGFRLFSRDLRQLRVPSGRTEWAWSFGSSLGRLQGSFVHRVWYP